MLPVFNSTRQAFSYFRMGLVTGLVDIETLINWVDREILISSDPPADLFELSLSGRLPYSRLIWLLSDFEGAPDYGLPLDLLLSRAGHLLQENPAQVEPIIMGLRLLNEEEYFPTSVGREIGTLRLVLEDWRLDLIPHEQLVTAANHFLDHYRTRSTLSFVPDL